MNAGAVLFHPKKKKKKKLTLAMPRPRAAVVAIALAGLIAAADALDELVAQAYEAGVEVIKVTRGPGGARGAGHGVFAGKGNVQDVGLVMARAVLATTAHTFAVAGGGQGERGLANAGAWAVVAVGVAPDAVKLDKVVRKCAMAGGREVVYYGQRRGLSISLSCEKGEKTLPSCRRK
jgi:hypothetical protein